MAASPRERLFWRSGGGAKWAVRVGDWKLVVGETNTTQLFNFARDLGEANDLAAAEPAVLARLQAAYAEQNRGNIKPIFESPRAGQPAKAKAKAK